MPHVHFTFSEGLKRNLEKYVPIRERSQFVSQATEQALRMQSLKKNLLSKRHVGTYPSRNPDAWIRSLRKKGRKIRSHS